MPTSPTLPPYEQRFATTLDQVEQSLTHYVGLEKERAFHTLRPGAIPGLDRLWEAIAYSTQSGGKRIRSVLTVETAKALGVEPEIVMPTACAIELVHTFSLIHDDLPCIDNDDLRRGRPTLHKAFDEALAVLTGDALLGLAFGLIVHHTPRQSQQHPTGPDASTILQVVGELSDVTSVHGLVNGQYVDIYTEGQSYEPHTLEYIHTFKTGALFTFALRASGLLAQAPEPILQDFTTFGQKLGLAFQIVDDLLDRQATAETLGKTPGKDLAQSKATYPDCYGMEQAQDEARRLVNEANHILDGLSSEYNIDSLRHLAYFIQDRIR